MTYIPCGICGGGVPGIPCKCHQDDGRMTMRVIDFPIPKGTEPSDDVIQILEMLLDCARQGSIRSFAYVAMPPDGNAPPATGFTGPDRNGIAMGFAMLMEHGVMWRRVS